MGGSYGPTIIDGVIQYLSPSGMTTADPLQSGGCFRRWYYKYVLGMKEPFTGSQKIGVATHSEIESTLLTGVNTLGHVAMSALEYIPPSEPELQMVEHKIAKGDLTVDGIRVVGEIDLVRLWGMGGHSTYIDQTGEESRDPNFTIELDDWKTTKNVTRWSKTGPELYKTIQMPLYGQWAVTQFPECEHVRLSHVYMQTQGRPISRKSTILLNREKLSKRWEQIEAHARILVDVAKETDVNKVEPNYNACPDFSGCPRRDICPKTVKVTFDQIFGVTKANQRTRGKPTMSITEQLAQMQTATPAPVATPVATPEPQGVVVTVDNFKAALASIEALGKGFPNLAGSEASAFLALKGIAPQAAACAYVVPVPGGQDYKVNVAPDGSVKGDGDLGTLQTLNFAQLLKLAGQVAPEPTPAPVPAALPSAIVAPNTPASDPAKAAEPVAGFVKDAADVNLTLIQPVKRQPVNTIEEPLIDETPAATTPTPTSGQDWSNLKNKAQRLARLDELYAENQILKAGIVDTNSSMVLTSDSQETGLRLFIDTVPSCPFDRLDNYVRGLCSDIEEQTGVKSIRCSDHAFLDFGKWKGALEAAVRTNPLDDGDYYIDTRGDEIAQVVANTLRESASLYSKGN